MKFSEKDFQILDALDRQEISTQRELAEHAGISLGQVNYVLRSLLEKGLVKIGNFRKNPHGINYAYLLTPKGLEAKSALAVKFVMSRLREYHNLRQGLTERLATIEDESPVRIVFVGSAIVGGLLDSIIEEEDLRLVLVDQCRNWKDLKYYRPESFDIALLFDGNSGGRKKISEATGISKEKLLPLW